MGWLGIPMEHLSVSISVPLAVRTYVRTSVLSSRRAPRALIVINDDNYYKEVNFRSQPSSSRVIRRSGFPPVNLSGGIG